MRASILDVEVVPSCYGLDFSTAELYSDENLQNVLNVPAITLDPITYEIVIDN